MVSSETPSSSMRQIHILVATLETPPLHLHFYVEANLHHKLFFPLCSVYSSIDVGKLQCFKWIKERFNQPNFRFCAIGDGWEECAAAQAMQWPFVKIDLQPDSSHRFPGVTPKTVSYYFAAVYGNSDAENERK